MATKSEPIYGPGGFCANCPGPPTHNHPLNNVIETKTVTVATEEANRETLEQQAGTVLAKHREYLAKAPPSNSDIAQQVKDLTKAQIGIIRLLLNKLDGTD